MRLVECLPRLQGDVLLSIKHNEIRQNLQTYVAGGLFNQLSVTAVHLMNNDALPSFDAHGMKIGGCFPTIALVLRPFRPAAL